MCVRCTSFTPSPATACLLLPVQVPADVREVYQFERDTRCAFFGGHSLPDYAGLNKSQVTLQGGGVPQDHRGGYHGGVYRRGGTTGWGYCRGGYHSEGVTRGTIGGCKSCKLKEVRLRVFFVIPIYKSNKSK